MFVDEDLDDVLHQVATLARRTLDDAAVNPYYGRVVTAGDLVAALRISRAYRQLNVQSP